MRREALIYRAEYDSENTFSTYVVGTASDTRLYIFIPTPLSILNIHSRRLSVATKIYFRFLNVR